MSIGLHDVDFFKHHEVIFNLEIMKLASYFKRNREITVLSPLISPERYSKFYLRKDYYDGTFPSGLNKHDNLTYGGLAFTEGIYIPMEEEIEQSIPDTHVYDKYKEIFYGFKDTKRSKEEFTSLSNNIHLRLSLDEKTIWKSFEKQILPTSKANIIYFHDKNLNNIKDSFEAAKYLLTKYSRAHNHSAKIGVKFPIICQNIQEFDKWNKFNHTDGFFTIQINGPISDEEIAKIIETNTFACCSRIKYNIAPVLSNKNYFIETILPKIFKQVIFCCNHHKQILLTIDDNFKIEKEWQDLIMLFNLYLRASRKYKKIPSFSQFCGAMRSIEHPRKGDILHIEDARKIFNLVYDKNNELFKMFYECNQVQLKGGEFVYE